MSRVVATLVVGLALGLGCGPRPSSGGACAADDDCAADERCASGLCRAASDEGDAGAPDDAGAPAEDGGASDGGTIDAGGDGGSPLGCTPNHDGVITSAEVPTVLGVEARYLSAVGDASAPVPVDVVGTVGGDGLRDWRFDGALPTDAPLSLVASPVGEHWFGSAFPGASYAAPLDAAEEVFGVFSREEGRLALLGVASTEESDDTLITYAPILDVLRFPMAIGDAFTAQVSATGTFEGNPFYTSTDTYEVSVDARGRVHTPAGVFDALRVRVRQQVRVPIVVFPFEIVVESIRYSFVSECLGQVASVTSLEGEDDPQFQEAAEVRRLGLMP